MWSAVTTSPAAFETELAVRSCALNARCGYSGKSSQATCEAAAKNLATEYPRGYDYQEAVESGRATFDASVAQACLDAVGTIGCRFDQRIDLARLCAGAVKPAVALDARRCLAELPPLVKGYLRLGGFVGDGAVIDEQFNTIDVCIIVKTDLVTEKYMRHYESQRDAPGGA